MRHILIGLLLLGLIPVNPVLAADKIKGKYEVIGDLKKLDGIKQVEMMEFFNYSCGHCYRFLETSQKLRKKFKGKLFHKKFPIYWGNQTPYPAMAFYISDEQGIEETFTKVLFDTNFLMGINIFQPRVIKLLSRDHGIENEMSAGMQSPAIKSKVENSMSMAKQFNANETPTVVLNGVLKVTPSISGGTVELMTENLEVIIDDLLSR